MSHPPGSGPPLPPSLLVSSKPGMHTGPSITHRTQRPDLSAPRPRETTEEPVALCPPLLLGMGALEGLWCLSGPHTWPQGPAQLRLQ